MFYLICDGGKHTIAHLWKRGIYPDKVIFSEFYLKDEAPYLTEEDDVLILVHGLTDLTQTFVHKAISILQNTKANLLLLTDVPFENVTIPIESYRSDIFMNRKAYETMYKKNKKFAPPLSEKFWSYTTENYDPVIVDKTDIELTDSDESDEEWLLTYNRIRPHVQRILPSI